MGLQTVHKTDVEQGCAIVVMVFSIITAVMLELTVGKLPVGVQVTYGVDVKLFNLCRLNAKTRLRLPVSLNFNMQLVKLTHSQKNT